MSASPPPTDLALTPSPFTPAPKFKPSPKLHPQTPTQASASSCSRNPNPTLNPNPGKCLVLFEEQAAATKAFGALNGRLFDGNAVRASFRPVLAE